MSERMVKSNEINIWTESFGDPTDPTVVLIMGATAQGIFWPEELCAALVDGGRHVIRYDNRDTGQSTCFDFAASPYTIRDMALDSVGVLDAYNIKAAHLVGTSMGGMIAQQVTVDFPERVLSLTSIMSTPAGATVATSAAGEPVDPSVPAPKPDFLAVLAAVAAKGPPQTRAARIDNNVSVFRAMAGTLAPFDEERWRALEERALDRAVNPDAAMNHGLAIAASPDRRDALGSITTPTLVIHGKVDPALPFEHGVATAKAIPGAKFVPIEGLGHELPLVAIDEIARLILDHTR